MKRATILIILLLCTSIASADIAVKTTTSTEEPLPAIFAISDGQQLSIIPRMDVGQTAIFIDDELTQTVPSIKAGERLNIESATGTHQVEIRTIKTYTYAWNDFDIIQNDEPIYLDYVTYDKDDDRINFELDAQAEIIHPTDVTTLQESSRKTLDDYIVTLNGNAALNCYPKVTSGKAVPFGCRINTYPETLDIEATLGLSEKASVTITSAATAVPAQPIIEQAPAPTTTQGPPMPPAIPQTEGLPQEIPMAEDIAMTDSIRDTPAGIPVTVFIILMFLAFMTILFVASHHNYENKQAGTHHKVRRKKN